MRGFGGLAQVRTTYRFLLNGALAQPAEHAHAVEARHCEIEHDGVDALALRAAEQGDGRLAVERQLGAFGRQLVDQRLRRVDIGVGLLEALHHDQLGVFELAEPARELRQLGLEGLRVLRVRRGRESLGIAFAARLGEGDVGLEATELGLDVVARADHRRQFPALCR